MVFWITALTLATLVFFAVLLVIWRDQSNQQDTPDVVIYRDQLAELDRDLARGLIADTEHANTRAEIARRILAASDHDTIRLGTLSSTAKTAIAVSLSVFLIAGSGVLYANIGAIGARDLPLKTRLNAIEQMRQTRPSQAEAEKSAAIELPRLNDQSEYAALVQTLREKLQENADDPVGFDLLGRAEARLGRFAQAHEAKSTAIALRKDAPAAGDYTELAEFLILATQGYVSPSAEQALAKAITTDPNDQVARYYTGLMWAQAGRSDLAFSIWRDLLNDSPPDAPWLGFIRDQLPEMAAAAGVDYTLPPLDDGLVPGPDAGAIAAAQNMDEGDRVEMIKGMVQGLATRLANDGGSPQEWARLIRALGVLGENDRAAAILAEGRSIFAADPASLKLLDDAAATLNP